jgi:hypothetical protein
MSIYSQIRASCEAIAASVGAGVGAAVGALPGDIIAARDAVLAAIAGSARIQDFNHAYAALPVGGVYRSPARATNGRGRAEYVVQPEDVGDLYIIHGPDAATVDNEDPAAPTGLCEIDHWHCAVPTAPATTWKFPVALRDFHVAFYFKGTAGKQLGAVGVLDPRPVSRIPLLQVPAAIGAAPATAVYNRPPGARAFFVTGCTGAAAVATGVLQRSAAAAPLDYRTMSTASGVVQFDGLLPLDPACTDILLTNLAAPVFAGTVHWYAYSP